MSRLTVDYHKLLTQDVLEKLQTKNIYTVVDFLESEVKQISLLSCLNYKDILSIKQHLLNKNSAVVKNGFDYHKELLSYSAIIPTGIKSFDKCLNGGLRTGDIIEICGAPACGKTQFCLTLAKNIVKNLQQQVYYIDTKSDFVAKKLKSMFSNKEQHLVGEVMDKILVNKIDTMYELINVLHNIQQNIKNYKMKVIIIDSLPPLIYQIENKPKSFGLLNYAVNIMRFLSIQYHMVIIVTNAITVWSSENDLQEKIGCGKYWLNIPNTRFKITKNGSELEISVLKSCTMDANNKCSVNISDIGVS